METADHNLVALLNGDEEKENYRQDINPGLNELLSITDAAVQGLGSKHQPKEMEPAQPLSSVQPKNHQLHSLSPDHIMALYGDGELDKSLNEFEPLRFRNSQPQVDNMDPYSSIHSKSSTASEILVRSTNITSQNTNNSAKETQDAHNMSCLSARSDVSVASSGFLTGNAHRVKVSSKKLKEVRSPFENLQPISKSEDTRYKDDPVGPLSGGPPCVTVSAGDVAPPIISINQNRMDSGPKVMHNRRDERNTNKTHNSRGGAKPKAESTSQSEERSKQQYQVERHVSKEQMTNILTKNKIEAKDVSSTDESLNSSQQVYRDLQNDCVITDVHGLEYNMYLNNSQTSSKRSFDPDMMATTSSKINAEVASNASSKRIFGFTDTGSLFIEDVIAGAMNDSSATPSLHTSANEDQYSQPEIVTIPDSIVTVTAQDKLAGNSTSGSDASSDNYPYALQDRFGKYRPAGVLRQGAPVDGVDPQRCMTSDSDMTVTQYGLSDRERQIRSNFVRRQQHGGPIKRVVQPKVIHTGSSTVNTHTTSAASTATSDAITTAAVAASAAVAATQPFLRAQQEVEHRMAEILEKLAVLQGTNPPLSALGSTMGSTAAMEKSAGGGSEVSGRVGELEKQLGDLTQRRLDYLEKMHEQQVMVQAKLLSISRLPGTASSDDLENYSSHSHPQESRRRPTGVSSGPGDHARADKYKSYRSPPRAKAKEEREKSVLDTPAPRKKPPTPMSFDGANKKSRSPQRSPTREKHVAKGKPKPFGFLEEILSGHDDTPLYGPFDQTPPNSLPSAHSRSRLEASPAVNQANDLVNELKDLKYEMRNALVGAPHINTRHHNIQPEEKPLAFASFNTSGPFPLDDFLKSSSAAVSSSPYPSLRPVPPRGSAGALSGPNAPLVQKYTDAEDTLQKVQQSRAYLETNLDAILRRHQDAEVVTFLEELTRDASATERLRIKKMVDNHIASMNTELQREIMEDMLKIEEAQKRNVSVMVAERDTNAKFKARPGVKTKGKVGSRIDTGLKKAGPSEPVRKPAFGRAAAKPQPTTNKPKVSLPKKRVGESETYLTRVYGKSLYHGMRNTQRDPKVRYSAASPAAKLAHSPPRLAAKAQQQRAASGAAPGVQGGNYYFTPSTTSGQQQVPTHAGVVTNPVQGQLIPMAIPLRAPRQESGGPPGGPWSAGRAAPSSVHSTPMAAESAPFASTPLENHFTPRPQVSLREEEDSVHPPGAPVDKATVGNEGKEPAISPIRQPSPRHHDDSVSSETATTARQQQVAPPKPQPATTTQQEPDEQLAGYEQDFEEEEDDEDTVTESWDDGAIALPGHQPAPVQAYHGPSFPPRAPTLTAANSSDVLGSDLRRKDIVANKAMEWVEQELLARLLSEMAEQRALEEAMRRPPTVEKVKTRTRSPNDSQCSDASSVPSEREPLLAEAMGREGLQMFVDAGVPVDDKLVSALIKEVLQEKMGTMTGQLTAADDDGPARGRTPGAGQDPPPRPRSRPQSPNKSLVNDNRVPPPQALSSPLPTPEVTPRTSPRLSPRRRVSPPATPDLTPAGSIADPPPLAPRTTVRPPAPDPDTTDTESIVFDEYRPTPIQGTSSVVSPTFVPRHDVRTPSATPPPSPPPGDVTPDLSLQEEPPRQPDPVRGPPDPVRGPSDPVSGPPDPVSGPVPSRVQTRDTGVMVNMVKIIRAYEDAEEDDDLDMVVVERSSRQRRVEQKPPREPSPPPKEPTPPPSPQSAQEETDQEEEEEVVPPRSVRVEPPRPEPVTTATQTAAQRTPSPSSTATQDDSTATEVTMDEAISEGEWLLTMHSEGEVRPVPLLHAAGGVPRGGDRPRGGGRRVEVDDTLHDYSDFDLDDGREHSADFSEGEFLHRGGLPLDQDPMLAYLYQMQHQPMKVLEEQLRLSQMAAAGHYPPPGQQVDKSLGEVSFYQGQQRMQAPGGGGGPRPILVQSGGAQGQQQQQQHQQQHQQYQQQQYQQQQYQQQKQSTVNTRKQPTAAQSASIGEAPSPGEVEGNSTSADSISDTQVDLPPPPPHPNTPVPKGPPEQEELQSVRVKSEHPQVVAPLAVDTREDDVTEVNRHVDVTEEVPPRGINLTKAGDVNVSPAASMERAPRLSDARKSGMMGGPIMSTDNVSRGGRRGGRAGSRGRFGGAGRPQTPDDGHGRLMQVRSSQDSDLQDTMESVDALRSTAGSDLRTMTPDQMNMEAILQSGQYLNTTVSSDGGSTTDFGRTGEIGTVRSTDFTRSEEFGTRSGVATGEFGARSRVATREYGTRSGEFGTRSEDFGTRSGELGERYGGTGTRGSAEFGNRSYGELDQDGLMSGTFGRSGRLNYTTTEFEQSGSEYSYQPGETEGSQDLQGTGQYADSLQGTGQYADSLQGTGQYADSLEGTGPLGGTGTLSRSYDQAGSQVLMRQSLQVSVTIPSMAQSDSGSELSASVEDVSEISMAT